MSNRPIKVTVVSWLTILISSLVVYVTSRHFVVGSTDLGKDIYELVATTLKIATSIGMLRGQRLARRVYLVGYAACVLAGDPLFYSYEWTTAGHWVSYGFGVAIYLTFAILLTRKDVDAWFGEQFPRGTPITSTFEKLHSSFSERLGFRLVGGGMIAVSSAVFLFFGYHLLLDLMTLGYEKVSATVVSVDIRDNESRLVENRDMSISPQQRAARPVREIRTFDPKVRYRYQAAGVWHESDRFATMGTTLGAFFDSAGTRDRYEIGTTVDCWIDRKNPERAVLQRGLSPYYIFALFNGILFVIGRTLWRHGGRRPLARAFSKNSSEY